MAPLTSSTIAKKNRQQLAAGPQRATPIVRPRQAAGSRRSARLQAKIPHKSLVSHALQSQPVRVSRIHPSSIAHLGRTKRKRSQENCEAEADEPEGVRSSEKLQSLPPQPRPVETSPIPPVAISQPALTKRKRPQVSEAEAEDDELEDVRPSKQSRGLSHSEHNLLTESLQKDIEAEAKEQAFPPSKDELSEKNLQILKPLNGETMDPAANNTPALKRTSSRRSMAPSEAGTERTQRSSNTTAIYRHKNLAAVEIHMHAKPPDYIQAAIDRIITADVSKERRSKLRIIAQERSLRRRSYFVQRPMTTA